MNFLQVYNITILLHHLIGKTILSLYIRKKSFNKYVVIIRMSQNMFYYKHCKDEVLQLSSTEIFTCLKNYRNIQLRKDC